MDEDLTFELYQDYLERSKIKPHIFFDTNCSKEEKNHIYTVLSAQENIPLQALYKHSVILVYKSAYFCAYYQDNKCFSYKGKAPK